MKTAYFDLIGGASGDMILAAMLDAGLAVEALLDGLADLNLDGYEISSIQTSKSGFRATQIEIKVTDHQTERHLAEIFDLITSSSLPEILKNQAVKIFQRLGEIEAGIHSVEIEKVHLHELGGLDTIIDVTGALIGLQYLSVDQVICSPFPISRGFIRGAHGIIPLPSPATTELLKGVPIRSSDIEKELVTPTGAAILTDVATSYGPIPNMTIKDVGYGAGSRDLPVPNLIRLLLGDSGSESGIQVETLEVLETNIDDLNPQIYDFVIDKLFLHGALDVTLTPIHMKKNRPAVQVTVLCKPGDSHVLQSILFIETSTLGVRRTFVERYALPRSFKIIDTPYGKIRVKTTEYSPGKKRTTPEYDDCRKLALQHGIPILVVYKAALAQSENI